MLELQGITKTYPGGVRALDAIDLTIGPGIFGLLGPNGAGKSSLMRTLATLQPPDAGSIVLDGADLLADPAAARRRIGYLPQDFGLYPNVSAAALLEQFALYKGFTERRQRRELVDAHLRLVNLEAQRDQLLGGFSGGMRQRFGIAQALLGAPKLLVVDEPTAGLDPAERVRLQSLLSELSADRVVLLSTHLVEDVLALCPQIAVMNRGRIVCRGAPEALMASLQGRVWARAIAGSGEVQPDWRVISTRVARGQRIVRVLSDSEPAPGFRPAEVELDDVYFTALVA